MIIAKTNFEFKFTKMTLKIKLGKINKLKEGFEQGRMMRS